MIDETITHVFPCGTHSGRLPSSYCGSVRSPGAPQPGLKVPIPQCLKTKVFFLKANANCLSWKNLLLQLSESCTGKSWLFTSPQRSSVSQITEPCTRYFIHVMLPLYKADRAEQPGVPKAQGAWTLGLGVECSSASQQLQCHESHGPSIFVLVLCPSLCSHSSVFVSQEKNCTGSAKEARKTLFKTSGVGERFQ